MCLYSFQISEYSEAKWSDLVFEPAFLRKLSKNKHLLNGATPLFSHVLLICLFSVSDPPSRTGRLSCHCRPPSDRRLWPADTASSTAARSLQWCHATACRSVRRCTDSPRPAHQRSSHSFLLATFQQSFEEGWRRWISGRVSFHRGNIQAKSSCSHAA